jgi:hypothetical protein
MVQAGIPATGQNDSSSGVPAYPESEIEGSKNLEHSMTAALSKPFP